MLKMPAAVRSICCSSAPHSLALTIAFILAPIIGCSSKRTIAPETSTATTVEVVSVQPETVPIEGTWVATLDGYLNAQIQPQVSGYLISQNYREGSEVAKGQVLYQIDPKPFEATLQQAQGALEKVKAQLALAEINVNRDTPLVTEHAISQSQLDTEVQQREQAKAAFKAAEGNVASAKINLEFTEVHSLISGVAGQAQVQVGNLVGPSAVLTSVSQLNPIKAYFSISDREYLALTQRSHENGKGSLIGNDTVPLHLILSNNEVYPKPGRIMFVDRQMNAQTGAIRIAAEFPNPGNVLRPGQFGRVTTQTEVLSHAIVVPQEAVQEIQGAFQVFVVTNDRHAKLRNVTLGSQVGQRWVIQSGLSAGDVVVVNGMSNIKDGALVNPRIANSARSVAEVRP